MWKPDALVCCSGGFKVLAYLAGLPALYEAGVLSNISQYVGVSAGSIVALLLTIGYTPPEILRLAQDTEVFSFSISDGVSRSVQELQNRITTFVDRAALVDMSQLKDKLSRLIVDKLGRVPTMLELYTMTQTRLVITIYNITEHIVWYCDHQSHPDLNPVDLVAWSCSIPGVTGFGTYKGKILVDGAIADPWPIKPVDDGQTKVMVLSVTESYQTDSIIELIKSFANVPFIELRTRIESAASRLCHFIDFPIPKSDFVRLSLTQQEKQQYREAAERTIRYHLEIFRTGSHLTKFTQLDD